MSNQKETTSLTVNAIDMNLKIDIKSYCVQNNIAFRDFIIEALQNELKKRKSGEKND